MGSKSSERDLGLTHWLCLLLLEMLIAVGGERRGWIQSRTTVGQGWRWEEVERLSFDLRDFQGWEMMELSFFIKTSLRGRVDRGCPSDLNFFLFDLFFKYFHKYALIGIL